MTRENGDQTDEPREMRSHWRNPAVVAALVTALIGGFFSVVVVLVPIIDKRLSGNPEPGEEGSGVEVMGEAPPPPEIATDPRKVVVQASRLLADPATALATRIELIRALKQGAGPEAPTGYHADAVTILIEYLRRAVDERRHVKDEFGLPYEREDAAGNRFEPDPRISRPVTVVEALHALDTIRDAAPGPLPVAIGNIDFSYMNLAGLDLSGFNAGHARFAFAFLSGCDCRGTNFNNADLRGVVVWSEVQSRFDDARLINTRIDESKWANVNFTGSDLGRVSGRPRFWCDIVPDEAKARFPVTC